ncbi:hypothetical protein NKG94_02020 [Micromonospora sp. M12]
MLTPGAIVAKEPERFGITNVRPVEGSDIVRVLQYDEPVTEAAQAEVAQAKAGLNPGTTTVRGWAAPTPRTRSSTTTATARRCAASSPTTGSGTTPTTRPSSSRTAPSWTATTRRSGGVPSDPVRRAGRRPRRPAGGPAPVPPDRRPGVRTQPQQPAFPGSLQRAAHPRRGATPALDRRTDGRRPGLADLHRTAPDPQASTPTPPEPRADPARGALRRCPAPVPCAGALRRCPAPVPCAGALRR